MKLYATTTSERASKGQGGNDYLDIRIYGDEGVRFCKITVLPSEYRKMPKLIFDDRILTPGEDVKDLKAKKQESERRLSSEDIPF
jgi:hypothetical protein